MFRIVDKLFRRKSKTTADQSGGKPIPSPQLLSLSNYDKSWRKICNSIWPSTADPRVLRVISAFPSAHRSFYSDSFLSTSYQLPRLTCLSDTSKLISAVDIYYDHKAIYSKVLETETVSEQFFSHPLTLHLLGPGETVPTQLKYDTDYLTSMSLAKEHLRLSWIVIDPYRKRAVNIASRKAVDCWLPLGNRDGVKLRYASVAALATGKLVEFAVEITCGWMRRKILVKEVKMQIKDAEGRTLNGRESMVILQAAMEGPRRRIEKRNYKKLLSNSTTRLRPENIIDDVVEDPNNIAFPFFFLSSIDTVYNQIFLNI